MVNEVDGYSEWTNIREGARDFWIYIDAVHLTVDVTGTLTPGNNVYEHEDGCPKPDPPYHIDTNKYDVNVNLDDLTVPPYGDAAYLRCCYYEDWNDIQESGSGDDWDEWADHSDKCWIINRYAAHKDRFPDLETVSGTYTLNFNLPDTAADYILKIPIRTGCSGENEFEIRKDPSGDTLSTVDVEISQDKMPIFIKLISNMTNQNDDYYEGGE